MQAHGVARRLVQDQGQAIELHHLMKPAGQVMEQRGQIAVRDDRFRHGQQGWCRSPVAVVWNSVGAPVMAKITGQPLIRTIRKATPLGGVEVVCTTHILTLFGIASIACRPSGRSSHASGATPALVLSSGHPPLRSPFRPTFPPGQLRDCHLIIQNTEKPSKTRLMT